LSANVQFKIHPTTLTSQSIKAQALRPIGLTTSASIDLVSLTLTRRAGDEPTLEVQGAEAVASRWRRLAESSNVGAVGDGYRVLDRVAQCTVRGDVYLLSAWHDNAERQCSIATSKDRGVAAGASRGNFWGAIGGGTAAAEVELVATSGKGQKVYGRPAAGRDDAKVRGTWCRSSRGSCSGCRDSRGGRSWNWAVCRGSQGARDDNSESESVLHVAGVAEVRRVSLVIELRCCSDGSYEAEILLRSCGEWFSSSLLPPYIPLL
jgi:hypothetical protein